MLKDELLKAFMPSDYVWTEYIALLFVGNITKH